jgi:hypothetical protein
MRSPLACDRLMSARRAVEERGDLRVERVGRRRRPAGGDPLAQVVDLRAQVFVLALEILDRVGEVGELGRARRRIVGGVSHRRRRRRR